MATFAKAGFDAAGYLASRPTYPQRLYDVICAYHRASGGQWAQALDLGCGPGFMALALAPRFQRVTALDPSKAMVAVGLQPEPGSKGAQHIDYRVGSAEDLGWMEEASVDLAVAGQAAHWFDHDRAWRELGRVVKPGGTVAYVGYGELFFPHHPRASNAFSGFMHGDIGKYWSQPGRRIVEDLLDAVPFPVTPAHTSVTDDVLAQIPDLESTTETDHPIPEAISEPPAVDSGAEWDAATAVRIKRGTAGPWALHRRWNLQQLENYMRTASAFHAFSQANPDDAARRRRGGRDGDVAERRIVDIADALAADGVPKDAEFDVAWPLVVFLAKRSKQ